MANAGRYIHALNVKGGADTAMEGKKEVLHGQRAVQGLRSTPPTLNMNDEGGHLFHGVLESRQGGRCMDHIHRLRLSQVKGAGSHIIEEDDGSSSPAVRARDLVRGGQQGVPVEYPTTCLRLYFLFGGHSQGA